MACGVLTSSLFLYSHTTPGDTTYPIEAFSATSFSLTNIAFKSTMCCAYAAA